MVMDPGLSQRCSGQFQSNHKHIHVFRLSVKCPRMDLSGIINPGYTKTTYVTTEQQTSSCHHTQIAANVRGQLDNKNLFTSKTDRKHEKDHCCHGE